MIIGKEFAESLENSYEENEKLFSTGNDELDDILTEVYYSGIEDGYDYAQRKFSEVLEQRLFRNKANREATRKWQMEQATKNRIVVTPNGQAELAADLSTPVGKGAGKGYVYGQAGPNGTRTRAERQAELLQEGRHTKTTSAVSTKGRLNNQAIAGSNARGTVLSKADGTIVGTEVALRDANHSLANKGNVQERIQKLSPERQKQLQEMRNKRAKVSAPKQAAGPISGGTSAARVGEAFKLPKTNTSSFVKVENVGTKAAQTTATAGSRGILSGMSKTGKVGLIGVAALGTGAIIASARKKKKEKEENQ